MSESDGIFQEGGEGGAAATPPSPEAEQALVRSVRCLDAGDPRAALEAADAAIAADPARAAAHYARGQACAELARHAEAGESFLAALRLKSGWPDAWINYGLARYQQGDVEGAKRAMDGALQAAPGHPVATANLGALLRITGQHETSEAMLRAALDRDPGNAAVRLNLVGWLLQEAMPGEALALLDAAPPAQDPHAVRHWHLQRAMALVAVGRPTEARAALEAFDALGPVPPELAPLRLWRLVAIADAEGDAAAARAAAGAMEAALDAAGSAAVLEHRVMGHYDLARFWSRSQDLPRAFAHWIAGHRLLRTIQPFSRENARAFAEATVAAFTAGRFARGPRATNRDPTPVFIVGMPRSGTTLCEQIIAAHAQAHGAGERVALWQLYHRLAGGDGPEGVARVAALPREALDAAASAYLADLHALAPEATRIVDKMPSNAGLVWLIALLFPAARIIHCTRDPRDIGLSIFTFRFHGEHGYAHDLADLGWTIAEQARRMAHWTRVLPNKVLTVRLQDWVEDFDATLARVLGFLDLPPDPACARFHESTSPVRTVSRNQVRQPVNARGLGRWKAYAAELAPLIAELERGGALDAWRASGGRSRLGTVAR